MRLLVVTTETEREMAVFKRVIEKDVSCASEVSTRISDLNLGDKSVEDMHRLRSRVSRVRKSLPKLDSPSTGFCASIFKNRG